MSSSESDDATNARPSWPSHEAMMGALTDMYSEKDDVGMMKRGLFAYLEDACERQWNPYSYFSLRENDSVGEKLVDDTYARGGTFPVYAIVPSRFGKSTFIRLFDEIMTDSAVGDLITGSGLKRRYVVDVDDIPFMDLSSDLPYSVDKARESPKLRELTEAINAVVSSGNTSTKGWAPVNRLYASFIDDFLTAFDSATSRPDWMLELPLILVRNARMLPACTANSTVCGGTVWRPIFSPKVGSTVMDYLSDKHVTWFWRKSKSLTDHTSHPEVSNWCNTRRGQPGIVCYGSSFSRASCPLRVHTTCDRYLTHLDQIDNCKDLISSKRLVSVMRNGSSSFRRGKGCVRDATVDNFTDLFLLLAKLCLTPGGALGTMMKGDMCHGHSKCHIVRDCAFREYVESLSGPDLQDNLEDSFPLAHTPDEVELLMYNFAASKRAFHEHVKGFLAPSARDIHPDESEFIRLAIESLNIKPELVEGLVSDVTAFHNKSDDEDDESEYVSDSSYMTGPDM